MHDHPHPGEILKEDVLAPRVLNGKSGISPELALRLEYAGVSTARFWMNLQTNYELAETAKQPPVHVTPLRPAVTEAR